jgi:hypothetical protein
MLYLGFIHLLPLVRKFLHHDFVTILLFGYNQVQSRLGPPLSFKLLAVVRLHENRRFVFLVFTEFGLIFQYFLHS